MSEGFTTGAAMRVLSDLSNSADAGCEQPMSPTIITIASIKNSGLFIIQTSLDEYDRMLSSLIINVKAGN
jgi:hypothetical protein